MAIPSPNHAHIIRLRLLNLFLKNKIFIFFIFFSVLTEKIINFINFQSVILITIIIASVLAKVLLWI